jgi:hypothetical protein
VRSEIRDGSVHALRLTSGNELGRRVLMQRSRTGACSWRGKEAGTICRPLGRVIFVLLMRCEFREVMSADCSLPKSAEPG